MDAIEGTASTPEASLEGRREGASLLGLATASLGVVYGDIGTSPLYTIREVFGGTHAIAVTPANVLGALSLVVWALLLVVSLKYVVLMLRADNHGEGGVLALMALAGRGALLNARGRWVLISLGLFGAALFYGDGMITPAISVLSAVEGLEVGMPGLEEYVIPITVTVIVALFMVQRHGTAGVASFFSPIVALWFTALALLGIGGILREPQILHAFNPIHGLRFFAEHQLYGFLALGAVFLAVTGSEALYADMGHFGKRPIRAAWFGFVLPALLLNYLGQGALLIAEPAAAVNPFYLLAPAWALFPLVGLATAATVIASQAVISGAFSITRQAIQLGYCPRMRVMHTSSHTAGQVYLPAINWALLAGTLGLVLGFQSSSGLASAYGIAVNGAMLIDTLLVFIVVRGLWNWSWAATTAAAASFLCIDLAFLGANSLKLLEGGWFPLVVAIAVYTLLSTWKRGRELLSERLRDEAIALESLLFGFSDHPPPRVPGTAVFLTSSREGVPHALLHNLAHNKVLHERVVFLTVVTLDVPWARPEERLVVRPLANNFYRITVRYGFKDNPDIPAALVQCRPMGLEFNLLDTSFFLSRETMIPTLKRGMARWRERLFIRMSHHAVSAMDFFRLPTNRVVELGTQIEI
jgi:KUP system potassium uptake protein